MWRPEPQRGECQQETGTEQAEGSGQMQKHEEEHFSRDFANKISLTLAG